MKDIKEIFSKPMTRMEFIRLLGVVILSFIGVANFIAALRSGVGGAAEQRSAPKSGRGFGSSKFGV